MFDSEVAFLDEAMSHCRWKSDATRKLFRRGAQAAFRGYARRPLPPSAVAPHANGYSVAKRLLDETRKDRGRV